MVSEPSSFTVLSRLVQLSSLTRRKGQCLNNCESLSTQKAFVDAVEWDARRDGRHSIAYQYQHRVYCILGNWAFSSGRSVRRLRVEYSKRIALSSRKNMQEQEEWP